MPKPLALNYLVAEKFGGPALVLQGAKDPLNDARSRAAELEAACPNIQVHLLDGGHCPVSIYLLWCCPLFCEIASTCAVVGDLLMIHGRKW